MIHDQGAYTPQGINLPYNASTAAARPLHAAGLRARRAGGRDQQGRDHAGARRGLSGGRVRHGAPARRASPTRLASRRAEVRRRNLVPPEKMPYVTPLKTRAGSAIALDSGDFPRCHAMALGGDRPCRVRRAPAARARGRAAISASASATGVKGTGRGPFESGIVRIGRSGRISVYTGAMAMGQGIKTALAQICAEQFGVRRRIRSAS